MDCLPLTDITSVQYVSQSNYSDELQSVTQVQDQMNLFIDMSVISVIIEFPFFNKIDIVITTRLVFLACRATLKNTFTLFQ